MRVSAGRNGSWEQTAARRVLRHPGSPIDSMGYSPFCISYKSRVLASSAATASSAEEDTPTLLESTVYTGRGPGTD